MNDIKRILEFLKSTSWPCRILFLVWVGASFFSPYARTDGIPKALIVYGIIFMLPAIGIEVYRWSSKKHQPKGVTQTGNNRRYSVRTDLRGHLPKKPIKRKKPTAGQAIGGTVLCVFGGICSGCLLAPLLFMINKEINVKGDALGAVMGVGVSGVILLFIGRSFLQGDYADEALERKARKEYERKMRPYAGVYLTERQLNRLEREEELPIVKTPVFLHPREMAVFYGQATRQESKNSVIGRANRYGGGTVRIAKGFSVHSGNGTSRPIYGTVSTGYKGEIVVTNERVVFLSEQKGFEILHKNITAVTRYTSGVSFQSRNTTYMLLLPRPDLFMIAFNGIQSKKMPFEKNCLYDNSTSDSCSEEMAEDIESVDKLDGYEFEDYCGKLLEHNGFYDVEVTQRSNDHGVDVLATKDGVKYAIQCKNYATKVPVKAVQEIYAGKAFYDCHVATVMTNSVFAPGAKELAQKVGVLIWDRTVLQEMIEKSRESTL